ncbi:hypothetical protein [Bordetella bronchiseptica]
MLTCGRRNYVRTPMPTLHFPRPSARHGARLLLALVALTLACAPMMARADDDDDDDDYRPRREYKEKYWDGACKVERKWKRNGEYREKRKCPGYRSGYDYGYAQPAMVPMIPANPAIIISTPPIVIRP